MNYRAKSTHLDQVEIEVPKAVVVGQVLWDPLVHPETQVFRVFPATLGHQDPSLKSNHSLIKSKRRKVAKKDRLRIPSHTCKPKLAL